MEKTIDKININFDIRGSGAPVLFLHGWGGCAQSFAPVSEYLKNDFQTITLDLPGFGESGEPDVPWSVSEYANIVQGLMDSAGIKKTHIIGHSFGGRIAILLAAQNPELVDKMILCDSAGVMPKRGLKYYFKIYKYKLAKIIFKRKTIKSILKAIGINVEKSIQKAGSEDYRKLNDNMKKTFVKVVNQDLRPYLKKIKSPVLLVWGGMDGDTPLYMAKVMEKEIPDAGLVVYEDAGHFAYLDRLADFNRVASYFLKGK
jgi:pimeloyl-ACP methyl ester carboxylesterase